MGEVSQRPSTGAVDRTQKSIRLYLTLTLKLKRSGREVKRELWNQGLIYLAVGGFVLCVVPFLYLAL